MAVEPVSAIKVYGKIGNLIWPMTVDSGATVSCMNEVVYNSLDEKVKAGLKEPGKNWKVRPANGTPFEILGQLDTPVEFQLWEQNTGYIKMDMTFLVMKNLVSNVLLGNDLWDRFDRVNLGMSSEDNIILPRKGQEDVILQTVPRALSSALVEEVTAEASVPTIGETYEDNDKDCLSGKTHIDKMDFENLNGTQEFKSGLKNVLMKHEKLFEDRPRGTEAIGLEPHRIILSDPNTMPIKQAAHRVHPEKQKMMDTFVNDMLKEKVIRESPGSAWSSPVVCVKKADGSDRFCTDYRKLNAVTKSDAYPLPRIDVILQKVGHSKVFSKLDLKSAFWQIPVRNEDQEKTAFICGGKLYEYLKMPFGLKNSPACFQRNISKALGENPFSEVYLDDIVVFSQSFEEHLKHLDLVLAKLNSHHLHCKLKKCEFGKNEIKFLGFVVNEHGHAVDPAKVEAIRKRCYPTSTKGVQSFLGAVNYYRKMIPDLAQIAKPLTNLTKKGVKWNFSDECKKAFDELKDKLMNAPILSAPMWERKFILTTDASGEALGAVLSQMTDEGEKVIEYASKTLAGASERYCTTDKECMAVHWAIQEFRVYLEGGRFTLRTDHKALLYLMTKPHLNGRLIRWAIDLEAYDYDVEHIEGKKNCVADWLSRPEAQAESDLWVESMESEEDENLDTKAMARWLSQDGEQSQDDLTTGSDNETELEVSGDFEMDENLNAEVMEYVLYRESDESERIEGSELWSSKYDCTKAQIADEYCMDRMVYLKDRILPEDVTKKETIRREIDKEELFLIKDGLLYRRGKASNGSKETVDDVLVLPRVYRKQMLQAYHYGKLGLHWAAQRTYWRLKIKYWWPGMYAECHEFVQSCDHCQRKNQPRYGNANVLTSATHNKLTSQALMEWSVDLIGKLPTTRNGNNYVVVFQDRFSRWVELVPVADKTALSVAKALVTQVICRYGSPKSLLSDRGKEFLNAVWSDVLMLCDIKHLKTSGYRPQTNGQNERSHPTLMNSIMSFVDEQHSNWDELLPFAQLVFNATMNETTKHSPFYMVFHLKPRFIEDLTFVSDGIPTDKLSYLEEMLTRKKEIEEVYKEQMLEEQKRKEAFNESIEKPRKFEIGEKVLVYKPTQKKGRARRFLYRWDGPWIIKERKENQINYLVYQMKNPKKLQVVHIGNMKPYKQRVVMIGDENDENECDDVEYVVEKIYGKRSGDEETEYLVKWKGYRKKTWEPLSNLSNCVRLVKEFEDAG